MTGISPQRKLVARSESEDRNCFRTQMLRGELRLGRDEIEKKNRERGKELPSPLLPLCPLDQTEEEMYERESTPEQFPHTRVDVVVAGWKMEMEIWGRYRIHFKQAALLKHSPHSF